MPDFGHLQSLWQTLWQNFTANLIPNIIFAIVLSVVARIASVLWRRRRDVWSSRHDVLLALSVFAFIYVALLAIRFNSTSARESATIASLQRSVERLNNTLHPHLTKEQQSKLKTALGQGPDISPRLWIVSYPECFQCRAYAWEFATTLNEMPQNQWKHKVGVLPAANLGPVALQLSTTWRGPIIGARDPQHLSADQTVLVKALRAADVSFSFEPISFTIQDEKGGKSEAVVFLVAPQAG